MRDVYILWLLFSIGVSIPTARFLSSICFESLVCDYNMYSTVDEVTAAGATAIDFIRVFRYERLPGRVCRNRKDVAPKREVQYSGHMLLRGP